jgi:hypothetical protein
MANGNGTQKPVTITPVQLDMSKAQPIQAQPVSLDMSKAQPIQARPAPPSGYFDVEASGTKPPPPPGYHDADAMPTQQPEQQGLLSKLWQGANTPVWTTRMGQGVKEAMTPQQPG